MANSRSKPMSVKDIVGKAQDFVFNPNIPLKHWLRTADILLKEAKIYEREYNDQQAYLLLMRYATLVADYLPKHPTAKEPESKKALKPFTRSIPDVIERLETLKPRIETRYNTWTDLRAQQRESAASSRLSQDTSGSKLAFSLSETDPAIAGSSRTLAAADHGDFAIKLAHKEIRRRETARRATRQAGISPEEEQDRRTAGLWDDWEKQISNNGRTMREDDLGAMMQATRQRMDNPQRETHFSTPDRVFSPVSAYHYPSVVRSQPLAYEDPRSSSRSSVPPQPPPRPRKEAMYIDNVPIRPAKEAPPAYQEATPSPPEESAEFTFTPSAYLENGAPLRTLFLPTDLRDRFLDIAGPNTRANLETCGILCGTLIRNALFISRLVIPEQKSTSDTCETVNESALFDYCDSEDLMVFGWIHTHPSQTCFMSSRDLHTHCGYQVMMPESIAIVCAPSKSPSWGVFRLTDPPGMKTVLNCQQTGLFHPHGEANIYTDALRPGHVLENKGLQFEIVDLRP